MIWAWGLIIIWVYLMLLIVYLLFGLVTGRDVSFKEFNGMLFEGILMGFIWLVP